MNGQMPREGGSAGVAGQPWFVAQLKPNCAAIAERNLVRQGFALFSPFEQLSVRHGQQFKLVQKPLFPGYVFINLAAGSAPWQSINGTYGVSRLVTFSSSAPAPVPPDLMASLMLRCDPAGKLLPRRTFEAGETARIIAGPFADFIGTVEGIAPQQRIWLLLDILGTRTRVAVSDQDLRLAS
jgi:transcriptional antiterminator RfaH